jgi:hypothetical protein
LKHLSAIETPPTDWTVDTENIDVGGGGVVDQKLFKISYVDTT